MSPIERAELERAELKLRQISQELRRTAPSVALKAGALARECEIRLETRESRR